jgi:hypothetical protein
MSALFFVRAFDFFDLSFEEPLFERADGFSIYNRSRFRHCFFALPCADALAAARNSIELRHLRENIAPAGQYPNINNTTAKDAWEIIILAL